MSRSTILSAADHHTLVPRDPKRNVAWRLKLLDAASQDRSLRQGLVECCREDILFYINAFVWQHNPKKKGVEAVGPFCTWDFQEAALLARPDRMYRGELCGLRWSMDRGILWCYENNKSAVVEKSREMGATWLFLLVQDWLAMFHPYFQSLNISRSEYAVDDPSPDSLFWKLRFVHEHLPDWMKGEVEQKKLFFGFKRQRSWITGEASTGRAGVGGRASVIFVDEFSKVKEATEVRQRTANTSDCRFFNSTHEGSDTEFYKLTQTPEFVKIQLHWIMHPEKRRGLYRFNQETNQVEVLDKSYKFPPDYPFVRAVAPLGGPFPGVRSPWYDGKCAAIGSPRGVAVELDIDTQGSVVQFFNPLTIRDLKALYAQEPFWEGDISVDWATGQPAGLVPVKGGPLKLWMHPRHDGKLPDGQYTIAGDISTGSGATNSVLSGLRVSTGEKVLEYATAAVAPDRLAPIATALGYLLHTALLGWEHKGPGLIFGAKVQGLSYPHIYYREAHALAGGKVSEIPGWCPTPETKRLLLEEYRVGLEQRLFVNRSALALEECLDYRYSNDGRQVQHPHDERFDDPTGATVNHGDRVIADAITWMLCKKLGGGYGYKKREEEELLHPGSLAFRFRLHDNLRREQETLTGW